MLECIKFAHKEVYFFNIQLFVQDKLNNYNVQ
jgi:hypothetical protein